jgi:hypothetical protein
MVVVVARELETRLFLLVERVAQEAEEMVLELITLPPPQEVEQQTEVVVAEVVVLTEYRKQAVRVVRALCQLGFLLLRSCPLSRVETPIWTPLITTEPSRQEQALLV